MGAGWELRQRMLEAGAPQSEVDAYVQGMQQRMFEAGAPPAELDEYWRPKSPDRSSFAPLARAGLGSLPAPERERVAQNPLEHLQAGWQMSASRIVAGKPNLVRGEGNVGVFNSMLYQGGMMVGDLPFMVGGGVGGFFGGGALGGAVAGPPGAIVGSITGSGAGAMGVPEAVRQSMMKYYQRSDPSAPAPTWQDFVSDALDVSLETGKAMVIGGVGAAVGGVAGGRVLAAGGGATATMGSNIAAQTVTQAGVQAAFDGQLPSGEDFIAGAMLAVGTYGGARAATSLAKFKSDPRVQEVRQNLEAIYERTGAMPLDLVMMAGTDPALAAEIMAPRRADGSLHTPIINDRRAPEPKPFRLEEPEITAKDAQEAPAKPAEGEAKANPIEVWAGGDRVDRIGDLMKPIDVKDGIGDFKITADTAAAYGFDPALLENPDYNRMVAQTVIADLTKRFDGNTTDMLVALTSTPQYARVWRESGRDFNDLPAATQLMLAKAEREGLIHWGINDMLLDRYLRSQGYADDGLEMIVDRNRPISESEWSRMGQRLAFDVYRKLTGAHRVVRGLDGALRTYPAPEAVAGYLLKFGKLAGFKFLVASAMTNQSQLGPHMGRYTFGRDGKVHQARTVFIPDNNDDMMRRWWGLGRYEVIHHEVGHAIDVHLNKGRTTQILRPDLEAEIIAASKIFRPDFWSGKVAGQEKHVLKPAELMADAIATWISNPTMREKMPIFAKYYAKKLEPFLEAANSALPRRAGEDATTGKAKWEDPPLSDKEIALRPEKSGGGGGGGGGKPPAPGGPDVFGPGDGNRKLRYRGMSLSTDMLNSLMNDWRAPEVNAGIIPDWLNPRKLWAPFEGQLKPAQRLDKLLGIREDQIGAEDMLRQTYASRTRAHEFWFHGPIDPITLEPVDGYAMVDVFKSIKRNGGNMNDFWNFMLAGRSLELEKRGIDSGSPLDSAQHKQILRDGKAKYAEAAQIMQEVKNAKVDYARDSGLFTPGGAAAMKDLNEAHVVLRRVVDPEYNPPLPGRSFNVRQPTKKIKGSDKLLAPDQLTTERDNFELFITMADRNRARVAVVNMANRLAAEMPELNLKPFEIVPENLLESDEFKKARKQLVPGDVDWKKAQLLDAEGNPIPWPEGKADALTPLIVERVFHKSLGRDEFIIFRDGIPEKWRAHDPDLAELMRMSWPGKTPAPVELMAKMASLVRTGVIADVAFTFRTLTYGQLSQAVFTKERTVPYVDLFRGFMSAWKQDEAFQRFAAKGGLGAALADMEANYIRRDVERIFEATGTTTAVWNTFRHPIEALHAFNQFVHGTAALGRFKRLEAKGMDPFKAAMETRKAYLDHGEPFRTNFVQTWARTVPFMSAGFKDLAQVYAALDPRGNPWRPVKTLTAAFGVLVAPTVLNYFANYFVDKMLPDEDKYENLPRWLRDGYWVLPPVNGVRLRVARGFGGTLPFSLTTERFLDWLVKDNPRAFEAWATETLSRMMPPLMPTITVGATETWAAKDFMTGRNLIPSNLEDTTGYMQYTPYTSETAKALARLMGPPGLNAWENASPILIENAIREYTGTLPIQILKLLETPFKAPSRPWEIADIPFVGSFFVRNPDKSVEPVQKFYERLHRLTQKRNDLRVAMERQNFAEIKESMTAEAMVRLTNISKGVSNISAVIDGIYRSDKLTKDEKRQQTDEKVRLMIAAAKAGLRAIDQIEGLDRERLAK